LTEPVVVSVTAALTIAKDKLRAASLRVAGEVTGFKPHSTYSAFYFQLKDDASVMDVTLWKNVYTSQGIELRDGMLVEMDGAFDVYTAKGRMSFMPRAIKVAGEGDLRAQVAARARKLEAEGLMSDERKKPLPEFPERIALVTSPNGAAVHDVLRTLARRYPVAEVLFYGTAVEGADVEHQIAAAIEAADAQSTQSAQDTADVILVVRGGGSFEDLLPFSSEEVARAIAAARTPIVAGIGHEPDHSIADMVADVRASTPTAAAEAVVPDREELRGVLRGFAMRIDLDVLLEQYTLRLDTLQQQLERALPGRLAHDSLTLDALAERMRRALPTRLARDEALLEATRARIQAIGPRLIQPALSRFSRAVAQLDALSPLEVLSRGYAAVFDAATNGVVDSVEKVTVGDDITVKVADGAITANVTDIQAATRKER